MQSLFVTGMFKRRYLAALIPLITAMPPVNAQELEEIIVTATKRAESLQDIPIAVNALQGDDLAQAGIDSQRAIAMSTPNVVVNANANFVAPYIRGVGTQYANPGLEPSVASYFNDLYLSRASAGFMQFFDVERVEVLKGPQGTLYGRNTTGGAIRIITKDPTDEFEGSATAGVGNYDKRFGAAVVSGPLSEKLLGRLAVQTEKRDGWVENTAVGPDVENRDNTMFHGKLLFNATEQLTVKLDVDWTEKEDLEGMAFQALHDGLPEQVGAAFGGAIPADYDEYTGNTQSHNGKERLSDFTAGGSQLRIDYEFDTFTFSSISGFRYSNFQGNADLDGTSYNFLNAHTVLEKTEDYSQEFQIVSNGGEKWDWLAGVFYFHENAIDDFAFSGFAISGDPTSPFAIGGRGTVGVDSLAPYGQLAYHVTDEWELMLGLRYTKEDKDVANDFYATTLTSEGRPAPYLSVTPAPDNDFGFEKVTPKLQVTWTPNEDLMFYAAYSQGVKSGGFNLPSPTPFFMPEIENEEIDSLELGWKTDFDRLRFNGSVYHYVITDLQTQITDPNGGVTSVTNAGEAEVTGIEGDLTYAATDKLQLGAGFGFQNAEFTDMPNGQANPPCAAAPTDAGCIALGGLGLATLSEDQEGNQLPQAPDLTGYLRATYTQPLDDMGEISFTLISSYTDEYSFTSDNLYNEDSKVLTNANVHWMSANGTYEVAGYITNLTDEEFYTHMAPYSASGGWKVPGAPRMYGVNLTVNF